MENANIPPNPQREVYLWIKLNSGVWKSIIFICVIIIGVIVFVEQGSHEPISSVTKNIQNPSVNLAKTGTNLRGYTVEKIWDLSISSRYTRAFAMDSHDTMYVSEAYEWWDTNSRILKYDTEWKFIGWFGKGTTFFGWHGPDLSEKSSVGSNSGEFYNIFKIIFDPDDNMYIIDRDYFDMQGYPQSGNDRIQKFDQTGNFIAWLGKGDKTFGWHHANNREKNITWSQEDWAIREATCIFLAWDDLLVSGWKWNRIDKFDINTGLLKGWLGKSQDNTYGWHTPDGKTALAAPYYGQEIWAFNSPFDCKVSRDNELYVLSYNSDPVIAIFDYTTGTYKDGLFHSEGYKPANMILDQYNNLILSDNYQWSIRFLNQQKQQVATLQLWPGWDYFGVGDFAFNREGDLFFLEKIKNKIYKIKLQYQ